MFHEDGFQGLSLSFAVDQFIELTPIFEEPSVFKGDCPFTGHSGGVVVNETKQTVLFAKLGVELSGWDLIRKLDNLFRSHNLQMDNRRPWDGWMITDGDKRVLYRINEQLKSLEEQIQQIAKKIKSGCLEDYEDWSDFEATVEIDYQIAETHRLYHPDSDNILCTQSFFVCEEGGEPHVREFVYNSMNDQSLLNHDFEETCLLHDLYDHQDCYIEDILQISGIWYGFIVKNDFHRIILRN